MSTTFFAPASFFLLSSSQNGSSVLFSPGVFVRGSASSHNLIYCLVITDLKYSELKTGVPWTIAKGVQKWHMKVAGRALLFPCTLSSMQELSLSPSMGSVSTGRPNTAEKARETHTQNDVFSLTSLRGCLMRFKSQTKRHFAEVCSSQGCLLIYSGTSQSYKSCSWLHRKRMARIWNWTAKIPLSHLISKFQFCAVLRAVISVLKGVNLRARGVTNTIILLLDCLHRFSFSD